MITSYSKLESNIVSKFNASKLLPVALLCLFCAVIYFNSLLNGFVYDDIGAIVENGHIKDFGKSFPAFFTSSYFKISNVEASYRPVATLSYFLTYEIWQLNPFGYHLLSLILHILNVVLVYFLIFSINEARLASLAGALLYAAHPVLTEAVNCISYNEDLLATLFFLLALLLYIKGDLLNYALSLLCFLLGMLSKEMAITLPAIIILYDFTLRNTDRREWSLKAVLHTVRPRLRSYLGYFALGLFYLALRFIILFNPEESLKPNYGNFLERILFLPRHILNFVKLVFFPVNLNADYVFSYPANPLEIWSIVSLVIVLALIALSFYMYKHAPAITFGLWWFLVTLFPVYNLIQIYNPLADRYLYLPIIGFFIIGAVIIEEIFEGTSIAKPNNVRALTLFLVLVVLISYSVMTIARSGVWKDSFRLWSDTIARSPNSSRAHGSLGRAYQDQGQFEEAIREYKRAVEINPREYKAHHNLGTVYGTQGHTGEAIQAYRKALEINRRFLDAFFNLGIIYKTQGLLSEAIWAFQRVIEIDPEDYQALNNLGVLYAMQGMLEEAIRQWERVLQIDPDNQEAKRNLMEAKQLTSGVQ